MFFFSRGSVILLKWYITSRVYCDIKKHPSLLNIINTKQTVSAKVNGQKGNSPDRKLKYINTIKIKIRIIRSVKGRLGSSHPIMKA